MAHIEFLLGTVTVVLTLAWLSSLFFLRRPASRDLVWRTALIVVALTPLFMFIRSACLPWQWPIAILPATNGVVPEARPDVPPVPPRVERISAADSEFAIAPSVRETGELEAEPAMTPMKMPASPPESAETSERRAAPSWLAIAAAVWLVGFLLQGVRIARAAWNGRRLIRSSEPVTGRVFIDLNVWAAGRVGWRRPVALVTSSQIDVPVVCGLWPPRLVIPPFLLEDDVRPQLRAALLHEYGHIRRRDLACELLIKVVEGALWPHPLVHLMARELRRLRETICDNYVLKEEFPVTYAEMLLRLSVSSRLRKAGMIGVGMLTRKHQLEARVDALLAPDRALETRARPATRWLLVGTTCVALFASIVVRLERVTAAPPTPAQKNPNAKMQTLNAAARPVPPREFRFRIVDADGQPVVGATVTPWALSLVGKGSFGFEEKNTAATKSDANGAATVVLTKDMDQATTAILGRTGAAGINQIGLRVDHPKHPVWSDYISVAGDAKIVLQDSTMVEVRAHRRGEATPATRLYPILSGSFTTVFDVVDGLLTIRRVDMSSARASRWLRIAQVPPRGAAWMSDVIDLKHIAGNPIVVDVELTLTVRAEGTLGDMIPRPVKNGRVFAMAAGEATGPPPWDRLSWTAAADIAADGTFVLESLPANGHLQIIALCDGWVSRSPTKTEVNAYAAEHGLTGLKGEDSSAGTVWPQWHRLKGAAIRPNVPMEPTAACEVTVLDREGKPLPNAIVQFNPNQFFHGYGSSQLGTGRDMAAYIREKLDAGDRRREPDHWPEPGAYSQKTDATGVAVISGLPGPGDDSQAFRSAMFFVTCEGFVARSNFEVGNRAEFPAPVLVATLSRGKTERVTIRMIPQPQGAANPNAGEDEGNTPAPLETVNQISGRVLDGKGRPIEGVHVLIFNQDEFQIRTDKTGRFSFAELPLEQGEVPVLSARFVRSGYAPLMVDLTPEGGGHVVTLQNSTYFEGVVRSPDAKPAANIRVRASQEWMSAAQPGVSENVWTETRTDPQGHYKLLVQPERYVIAVGNSSEALAWIPDQEPPNAAQSDPSATGEGEPAERSRLFIAPNEKRKLDVQLEAGVDFRARIVDSATRKPVAGVYLYARDYPDATGESDRGGEVVVSSLPARDVAFSIGAKGYLRMGSEEAAKHWKDSVRHPGGPSPAMISIHERILFDLQPGMPEVTILVEPPVTVQGRVLDPNGNPLADATVRLVHPAGQSPPTRGERWRNMTYTKRDGRFSIELPSSDNQEYNLMVHDGGRRPIEGGQYRFDDKEWRTWANGVGPLMKTVAGQKIDNVELRVTRPGAIRGRVVNQERKPVAGVALQSIATDGQEGTIHNPAAQSDREGWFELRLVRPGHHRLHGRDGGKIPSTSDPPQPIVDVRSGETTNVGDVLISPGD